MVSSSGVQVAFRDSSAGTPASEQVGTVTNQEELEGMRYGSEEAFVVTSIAKY